LTKQAYFLYYNWNQTSALVVSIAGDDVDASLIIAGGRASRRGRATFTAADFKNMPDSDSD
jgi:hypothetical protein